MKSKLNKYVLITVSLVAIILVAGVFSEYTEKTAPIGADKLLIYNSETGKTNTTSVTNVTKGLNPASETVQGVVTTGTQTFAGDKLFTGKVYINPPISTFSGHLNIKMTNNISPINIYNDGSHNTSPSFNSYMWQNSTSSAAGGSLIFVRGGGTQTSTTAPVDNEVLGTIYFREYTTSAFHSQAATIAGVADGNSGSGSAPGKLLFKTTPTSSTTPVIRQSIRQNGLVTFNETGTSTGDVNIVGDTDTNLVYTDASTDRVGIGTATPSSKLEVEGAASAITLKYTGADDTGALKFKHNATETWTLSSSSISGIEFLRLINEPLGADALFVDNLNKIEINSNDNTPDAYLHSHATSFFDIMKLETHPELSGDSIGLTIKQAAILTTNATPTTIHVIPITSGRTYKIKADAIARRTGGTAGTADDGASYTREWAYTTKSATVTQLGSDGVIFTAEDQAGWDIDTTISGTDVLIQVVGAIDNNITWHLTKCEISSVSANTP